MTIKIKAKYSVQMKRIFKIMVWVLIRIPITYLLSKQGAGITISSQMYNKNGFKHYVHVSIDCCIALNRINEYLIALLIIIWQLLLWENNQQVTNCSSTNQYSNPYVRMCTYASIIMFVCMYYKNKIYKRVLSWDCWH